MLTTHSQLSIVGSGVPTSSISPYRSILSLQKNERLTKESIEMSAHMLPASFLVRSEEVIPAQEVVSTYEMTTSENNVIDVATEMEIPLEETSGDQGTEETLTINLEDDTQIIFQETEIDGELQAVEISPGTFQILTGQTVSLSTNDGNLLDVDGNTIQVSLEVLQSLQQHHQVELHNEDEGLQEVEEIVSETPMTLPGSIELSVDEEGYVQNVQMLETEEQPSHEASNMNSSHNDAIEIVPSSTSNNVKVICLQTDNDNNVIISANAITTHMKSILRQKDPLEETGDYVPITSEHGVLHVHAYKENTVADGECIVSNQTSDSHPEHTYSNDNDTVDENTADDSIIELQSTINPDKDSSKPDLTCPIEVDSKMEVVIKGKRCVLMTNPETGQLCAYPLVPPPGKRRPGRPRKQIKSEADTDDSDHEEAKPDYMEEHILEIGKSVTREQQSSAAQGLLELSNFGIDNLRRSGRKRKKALSLADYDLIEMSSDDETFLDIDDIKNTKSRRRIQQRQLDWKPTAPCVNHLPNVPKRGRGRPRRYPVPGQPANPAQIPAIIIPTATGQTLMMAPRQCFENVQGAYILPSILQKLSDGSDQTTSMQTIRTVAVHPGSQALLNSSNTEQDQSVKPPLNRSSLVDESDTAAAKISISEEPHSSVVNPALGIMNHITASKTSFTECTAITMTTADTPAGRATILQLPDELVSMFTKKDPLKIGLKALESELAQLKCPKCDFQAYYSQQYHRHIMQHTDDVIVCKCCTFATFEDSDLQSHFKKHHPRNVCHLCGLMTGHAYLIKRHMMRHTTEGCHCEICGKTYKDQYILKMHVKMVHMPAEVLYECTICGKNFTRKAHLTRHIRTHQDEKPYKCPQCEYRGCEKSDISKHVLIHQAPQYSCEECGKSFRHIKNKELHMKRHTGHKDYKCGVCGHDGYTFTDIRKHIERKHLDLKHLVFTCPRCGAIFNNDEERAEHQSDCTVIEMEEAMEEAMAAAVTTNVDDNEQADSIDIPVDSSSPTVVDDRVTFDSQQISVGNDHVNITVEPVNIPEGESITLTEEQISEAHISVSESDIACIDVIQNKLQKSTVAETETDSTIETRTVEEVLATDDT